MKEIATSSNIGAFLRDIERHPLLSREEEFDLAVRHRETGDLEAARMLVTSNLRFVVRIAKQYTAYGTSLLDLIQEGSIGLMTAVKKFNPHRGYRLISYAIWWIKARIHEHIMRFWSSVRIGGSRKERKLFHKTAGALRKSHGLSGAERKAELEKLSETLGVSSQDISEMEMRTSSRDFSLDADIQGEGADGSSLIQLVADATPSQETVLAERQSGETERAALKKAIRETLNERERKILASRFMADTPAKLEDLGGKFGISAERVRQIESGAISKLRRSAAVNRAKELI